MGDNRYSISIFAPMTGSVVDLSQVPDPMSYPTDLQIDCKFVLS